jgi:hypothetical protein
MDARIEPVVRRSWIAIVAALVSLGFTTPAMAMGQCRPGSGLVDRWPFFVGVGLTLVPPQHAIARDDVQAPGHARPADQSAPGRWPAVGD